MTNLISSLTQMNISRIHIRKILEVQSIQNQEILNSSKEKNVVVFVGRTGSGKSTLINYLAKKELCVDANDNIVLKNQNDLSAMKIGVSYASETLLPKFIECNQFLLYDLPGIGDTRGTAVSLVNAAFIKSIIENAETVRIIFVISQDEIIASKGVLFKQLLSNVNTLIPNESIEEISALVITKSSPKKNNRQLVEKLKEKMEEHAMTKWHNLGHFAKMELVDDNKINEDDRETIFDVINKVNPKRINFVNIGAIFDNNDKNTIKDIYLEEMEDVFQHFLLNIIDAREIKTLSVPDLERKKNHLNKAFDEFQYDCSPLIKLLKIISEDIYNLSLTEFKKLVVMKIDAIVASILIEIKEKQRQQAHLEMKAEAVLRLLAEQQQKKAEQLMLEEERRRERIERENNPQNWPIISEKKTATSVSWGDEFAGDWEPYRGGSGLSRRTKHRKQFYEKELLTTTVTQRDIRKKKDSEMVVFVNDWYVVSTSINPTGNIRATGRFCY